MFQEVIVVDYITDINALTSEQSSKIVSGLANPHFLESCPCGTIIAIPISGRLNNQKRVYFPFFSHLTLPLKAGERAWVFDQTSGQASYWLTRKVQNTSADDLNFSHDDRARLHGALKSDPDGRKKNSKIFFDSQSSAIDLDDVRAKAISKSEFAGEPVLAIQSKSIDLTIQGSNGTAIKLSCDDGPGSGTIDIIAGLAMIKDQAIVKNSSGYDEIIKPILSTDDGYSTAGKLSKDDESRIILSRKFNADSYYSMEGNDSGEQPTIAIKSNGIRVISENDFKIKVAGGTSIIIKSDGNIVITPGDKIRLSGESDDQAYLRYDQFNQIIQNLLDICGALQSSLGPSAIAAVAAGTPLIISGNIPGTPSFDTPVNEAIEKINIDRISEIGLSTADIMTLLETIKSKKILGS